MDTKAEIEKLREELTRHSKAYYDKDAPVISDFEYDAMMRSLIELEEEYPELKTADSPTQRVGGKPSPQFSSVRHAVPLESLNDVFSFEELDSYIIRTNDALGSSPVYVTEPKIDDKYISLDYISYLLAS